MHFLALKTLSNEDFATLSCFGVEF